MRLLGDAIGMTPSPACAAAAVLKPPVRRAYAAAAFLGDAPFAASAAMAAAAAALATGSGARLRRGEVGGALTAALLSLEERCWSSSSITLLVL